MLVSGIVAVVLLVSAPFGYKFGVFKLGPSFINLLLALIIGILVFLGSIVMVFVAARKGLARDRNLLVAALILGLVPTVFLAPKMIEARSAPPIHDISTDTVNPPQFHKLVQIRRAAHAVNSLEYGAGFKSTKVYAAIQEKYYPKVKTLHTHLSVADATVHAKDILASQGMKIIDADPNTGTVEAVATSHWFGFKDDLVVRVKPATDGNGSIVDVRSVSRVGISDLGVNAHRIVRFLNAF